jgi:hypothetical protein
LRLGDDIPVAILYMSTATKSGVLGVMSLSGPSLQKEPNASRVIQLKH